ncbi:MAG TPA: hypothetical protein VKQ72_05285 [Aggregatilineales bacterium]|nr:hypothetical protein [Aggregatilineales bacterium]
MSSSSSAVNGVLALNQSASATPVSETQIKGNWRIVARALWAAIIALNVCLFVVGLAARIEVMLLHSDTTLRFALGVTPVGISDDAILLYRTILDLLLVLGFWIVAIIIYWRRSSDWMAIFVSATLFMMGLIMTSIPATLELAAPQALSTINSDQLLGFGCFLTFLFLFPDGRFVPRWTAIVTIVWVLWLLSWHFLPGVYPLAIRGAVATRQFIIIVPWFFIGIIAQVYRRFQTQSDEERQQTRWVAFGFVCAFIGIAITFSYNILIAPHLPAHRFTTLLLGFVVTAFFTVGVLCVPITLAISILRYRLWQIESFVSRTIVYTLLTGTVAVVFVVLSQGFQLIAKALGGNDTDTLTTEIVTAAASAVTALAFPPIKDRFQKIIDRRFYREKVNPHELVAAFSREIHQLPDAPSLFGTLLTRAQPVAHFTYGAVFLSSPGQSAKDFKATTIYGDIPEAARLLTIDSSAVERLQTGIAVAANHRDPYWLLVPCIMPFGPHNESGGLVAIMALGPHLSGQNYSDDDKALLTALTNQVGMALVMLNIPQRT